MTVYILKPAEYRSKPSIPKTIDPIVINVTIFVFLQASWKFNFILNAFNFAVNGHIEDPNSCKNINKDKSLQLYRGQIT